MRHTNGTFLPGFSGNPSGRPAVVSELQKLARAQTPAALSTLIEVMNDEANPPNARVAAAIALLDRGYGRPSSAVVIESAAQFDYSGRKEFLDSFLRECDEGAARLRSAEKRAAEAEQRVAALEGTGSR